MSTQTDYLKSIAEEIITYPNNTQTKPNPHLKTEVKRLEKAIIRSLKPVVNTAIHEPSQVNTLCKLVNICDILYSGQQTITPDVKAIIELLNSVKQVIPEDVRPNLQLPKAFVALHREGLLKQWTEHREIMERNSIHAKLIEIAGIAFGRFTEPKQTLYWSDFTWLKGYQAKLDIMDWENADCNSKSEALLSLLIGRDFNDDRFYIYCKKYIELRTKAANGKRNKLLAYAECEKLVLQDTQTGMPSFDGHANSVSTRLIKWIREEIDFVETHERERPLSKFEFKWNVETIAFFFKLLWDHKVFGKVSLEPLSEQIAANCSSVGKDEFQATTIFSRFYVKDREVLKAVEKVLSGMLEDVRRFL